MGDKLFFHNDNCWIIYAGFTWQNYHIIQGNNQIMRSSVLLWSEYKEVKFTTFSIVLSDLPKKLFHGGNQEDVICELLWADFMCALMYD